MAVNDIDSQGRMRLLLETLTFNRSINNSSKHFRGTSDTIGVYDWQTSLANGTSKDISNVLKEVDSVNNAFEQLLKGIETLTGNFSTGTDKNNYLLSNFLLVSNGYIVSILSIVGILINLIGIAFLFNGPRRRKLYSLFLSSLLFFDAFFLLFELSRSIEGYFFSVSEKYSKTCTIIMNSGIRFTLTSSIWMLVALGHIRLSAIRKPFQHNNDIMTWKERRNYWFTYFFPIVISATIFTLPIILEVEDVMIPHEVKNVDSIIISSYLGLNLLHSKLYIGLLNLTVTWMIPIFCLVYLTHQTKCELKKRNRSVDRFRIRKIDQEMVKEDRITKKLVTIIITFLVLHSIRVIWIFSEFYILLIQNKDDTLIQKSYNVPTWHYVTASLSEIFMVINSSVNAIIYLHVDLIEVLEMFSVRNSNRRRLVRHLITLEDIAMSYAAAVHV